MDQSRSNLTHYGGAGRLPVFALGGLALEPWRHCASVRLFVAVNLPETARREAHAAAAPLRAGEFPARWLPAESLHITLQFLGEVEPAAAEAIGAALEAAVRSARSFDLWLGGYGAFPDLEHPRVVWLGVERHPALELLANDVARVLAPLGFAPELRPFAPHVTLGRARRGAHAARWAGLAERLDALDHAAMMRVESVDLMESVPGAGGSSYRLLRRAPLSAGE